LQVYLDGEFLPAEEARISVFDQGFLLGYGAFETMRTYGSRVFRLAAHLKRLNDACAVLGIPFRMELEEVEEVIRRLVALNLVPEARVRITVTAGDIRSKSSAPTVLITATALSGTGPVTGIRAVVSPGAVSSQDALQFHKTTSYARKMLGQRQANQQGYDEALLVNEYGRVTEGTKTNLFCVREGELFTPPLREGLLPGITRAAVIEIASFEGITVREEPLTLSDVQQSEEAFLTNSVIEIAPLVAVNEVPIGQGIPGPLVTRLQEAYRNLVAQELGL